MKDITYLKDSEEKYKVLERRVKDYYLEHLFQYPNLPVVNFTKFLSDEKCPNYDTIFKLKFQKEYQWTSKEETKPEVPSTQFAVDFST